MSQVISATKLTNVMEGLEQSVSALGLGAPPVPYKETSEPFTNPLELCRAYLASILKDIAQCSEDDAHKAIQWPNNIFNGDLAVVLPKLKPGIKADKIAVEIIEKVILLFATAVKRAAGTERSLTLTSFQRITLCFLCHFWMEYTFAYS